MNEIDADEISMSVSNVYHGGEYALSFLNDLSKLNPIQSSPIFNAYYF